MRRLAAVLAVAAGCGGGETIIGTWCSPASGLVPECAVTLTITQGQGGAALARQVGSAGVTNDCTFQLSVSQSARSGAFTQCVLCRQSTGLGFVGWTDGTFSLNSDGTLSLVGRSGPSDGTGCSLGSVSPTITYVRH